MTERVECRTCGEPATWVMEQARPAAVVKLDGTVVRFVQQIVRYYCDAHVSKDDK